MGADLVRSTRRGLGCRLALATIVLGILLLHGGPAGAFDAELEGLLRGYKSGSLSETQKVRLLTRMQDVEMMAERGIIPKQDLGPLRNDLAKWVDSHASPSAQRAGLRVEPQIPTPKPPQPGGDTDLLAENARGQATRFDQVRQARENFNRSVNAELQRRGLPPMENPSGQLAVDIMGRADKMPVKDFRQQANLLNREGGTLYEDPNVADSEAKFRAADRARRTGQDAGVKPGTVDNVQPQDLGRRVSEMQRQVKTHDTTGKLLGEADAAARAGDVGRAERTAGQAQLAAEQTGKYVERVRETTTKTREQLLGESPDQAKAQMRESASRTADGRPRVGGTQAVEQVSKTRGPESRQAAETVHRLRENLVGGATEDFTKTMTDVAAKKPELKGQALESAAEAMRNRPASEKGAVIEQTRAAHGDKAAGELAKAMRDNPVADTPDRLSSRVFEGQPDEVRQRAGHGAEPAKTAGPGAAGEAGQLRGKSSFQEATLGQKAAGAVESAVEAGKRADTAVAERLQKAVGLGELPAGASALRRGVNAAGEVGMGVLAVGATAVEGFGIGKNLGEGQIAARHAAEERAKAAEARTQGNLDAAAAHDARAEQYDATASEKRVEAGKDAALLGGMLAVGSTATGGLVLGVAGAGAVGLGAYAKTREVLETTETGQRFEAAKTELTSRVMELGDTAAARLTGQKTAADQAAETVAGRQQAWERALDRGDARLKEGQTREDLLAAIKRGESTGELGEYVERVPRPPAPPVAPPGPAVPPAAGTPPAQPGPDDKAKALEQLELLKKLGILDAQGRPREVKKTEPPGPEGGTGTPEGQESATAPAPADGTGAGAGRAKTAEELTAQILDRLLDPNNKKSTKETIVDVLEGLRSAEQQAARQDTGGEGGPDAVRAAAGKNVAGTYLEGQATREVDETRARLGEATGVVQERAAAGQIQHGQAAARIAAQGQEVDRTLAQGRRESTSAEAAAEANRRDSTLLVDALVGGVTSGVASGLDQGLGTLGRGAGDQASRSAGVHPPGRRVAKVSEGSPPDASPPAPGGGPGADPAACAGVTTNLQTLITRIRGGDRSAEPVYRDAASRAQSVGCLGSFPTWVQGPGGVSDGPAPSPRPSTPTASSPKPSRPSSSGPGRFSGSVCCLSFP